MTIGSSNLKEPTMRITRSRAKALGSSGGLPPRHPSVRQDNKQGLGAQGTKYKRSASDENNPVTNASTACQQPKRRAVLRDVTNVLCENSYMNCINRSKFQASCFFQDSLYHIRSFVRNEITLLDIILVIELVPLFHRMELQW